LAAGFTAMGTGVSAVQTALAALAQTIDTILSEINTLK
jgi:hypothetical protein